MEKRILMAKAFEQHGVGYEFMSNPDWGDMFDLQGMEDATVRGAFNQVLEFLEKHVK